MEQITPLCLVVYIAVANKESQAVFIGGAWDSQLFSQLLIDQGVVGVESLGKGEVKPIKVAGFVPHQPGGEDGIPHRCTTVRLIIHVEGDGDRAAVVEKKIVAEDSADHASGFEHQLLDYGRKLLLADRFQRWLQHGDTAVAVVKATTWNPFNCERLLVAGGKPRRICCRVGKLSFAPKQP